MTAARTERAFVTDAPASSVHGRSAAPPSSRREFEAPEVFGREALRRIERALPWVERAYASVRFSILRPKLLSVMDLMLTDEGRILDVGCGFGLFAAYFGQTQRRRSIVGIDPDTRRVRIARDVAASLGLDQHEFVVGDVRDARLAGPFDAVYML